MSQIILQVPFLVIISKVESFIRIRRAISKHGTFITRKCAYPRIHIISYCFNFADSPSALLIAPDSSMQRIHTPILVFTAYTMVVSGTLRNIPHRSFNSPHSGCNIPHDGCNSPHSGCDSARPFQPTVTHLKKSRALFNKSERFITFIINIFTLFYRSNFFWKNAFYSN